MGCHFGRFGIHTCKLYQFYFLFILLFKNVCSKSPRKICRPHFWSSSNIFSFPTLFLSTVSLIVLKTGYNKNNVATVKRIRQLYPEWQPIKVRRLVNFNWPLICNRVEFKTSIVCAIILYRYIKATQNFRSVYNKNSTTVVRLYLF